MNLSKFHTISAMITMAIATCDCYAERFVNVSSRKVKITILDKKGEEINKLALSPLAHAFIDLARQGSDGITVVVKQVRGSFLRAEKNDEDRCQECVKNLEKPRCNCEASKLKKGVKQEAESEISLKVSSKDMHGNNEFIIMGTEGKVKIKMLNGKKLKAKEADDDN